MYISSYILLGDPAWLRESVQSYYSLVDEIVAVYDEKFLSWSGNDISSRIELCLHILNDLDVMKKVRFVCSNFVSMDGNLTASETSMRQFSILSTDEKADVVIQLDTDEIIPDIEHFSSRIVDFYHSGMYGMEYAARWLYTHIRGDWYLERCNRRFTYWHAIPGPVVVRRDAKLVFTRQISEPCIRYVPGNVERPMAVSQAILHTCMLRTETSLWEKYGYINGHSKEQDVESVIFDWMDARRNPLSFVIMSKLRRRTNIYRPVCLGYASKILRPGVLNYC